jgi:nucleoside-diphosphate-sugar epimerase
MAADKLITHVVSLVDRGSAASPLSIENAAIESRKVNLHSDLSEHFRFADAVVYLSWLITGTERGGAKNRSAAVLRNVCAGLETAQIHAFIYGSAVGASDPRLGTPMGEGDEPSHAVPGLAQEISRSERCIDQFEVEHAMTRMVRLRPGLIICPSAEDDGTVGRMARRAVKALLKNHRLRLVPSFGPHPMSVVHVGDLAEAVCLALNSSAIGTFDVVADPVTPDLLAQVFGAKAVPVKPRTVEAILAVARRLGLHALDPEWFALALHSQVDDGLHLFDQDALSCRRSTASILHEWIGTGDQTLSAPVEIAGAPLEPIDLRSLYGDAISYFGSLVHDLADDQWSQQSEYQDWTIWQLVASAALSQYRLALLLKHKGNEAEIEALLPGDPLGIAPADGWNLAAEQAVLALGASGEAMDAEGPIAIDRTVERFVSDAICEILLLGSSLAGSIAAPGPMNPELEKFVHRRRAEGRDTVRP